MAALRKGRGCGCSCRMRTQRQARVHHSRAVPSALALATRPAFSTEDPNDLSWAPSVALSACPLQSCSMTMKIIAGHRVVTPIISQRMQHQMPPHQSLSIYPCRVLVHSSRVTELSNRAVTSRGHDPVRKCQCTWTATKILTQHCDNLVDLLQLALLPCTYTATLTLGKVKETLFTLKELLF